ncbi:MAG TPA: NAD(P)/FAD-dependent oxidoreductase, partial [Gemmatimonadales bacterium]|nr:NAD(P)/FAD-dependent oxidoreductase [Gemmatimonadales bacterium]
MIPATPVRVVILGGGFGGLFTAIELEKRWPREVPLDLTLVSRDNHMLFTPMLHEVAASDVDITHVVNPVRKLLKRAAFFAGEVEAISLDDRSVTVCHVDGGHRHELPFDHVVLALGSVTNFFGLPGLAERALTMKSLGDAITIRNRAIQLLEEADFECKASERHDLLTFVIAGGGFAGVETAAALNDFLRDALEFYPHLGREHLRVILVHPGNVLLPELDPRLGEYAGKELRRQGIEVHLNAKVTGMSADGVCLGDGTLISSRNLIWTAGTAANPALGMLPCDKDRGRIAVDATLAVPGFPGVWALGDCAAIPDPRTGKQQPPTAQHAIREAKVAATNIIAQVTGRPLVEFRFPGLGQLAAIGRRRGVAQILGIRFSGFLAWWLWRTIYLSKLPRLERKIRVALDWALDLVFSKDIVQFQTFR